MTKDQLIEKMEELLKTNKFEMEKRLKRVLKSGALDLDEYPDNYHLPKMLMSALCIEMSNQWKSDNYKDNKTIKNLTIFM